MRIARVFTPLMPFALVLAGWEAGVALSGVSPLVLPAPSAVLQAMWVDRAALSRHTLASLRVAALGFTLSVVFACLTSLLLQVLPWLSRLLMPLFVASQTVPLVALAPLMVLWFGFGLLPKVLLVVLVTFLPLLVSLLSAYRQTPQAYLDLLASMGAGTWEQFRRARLPAARAGFLAGLRISATYAIVATIFAEYAGSRQGLGIYLLTAKNNFRADLVLAAVLVSALLTLALLGLIGLADRLTRRGPAEQSHA